MSHEQNFYCTWDHHVSLWMMPHRNPNIAIGCTLIFIILLHCFVFWYYVFVWGFYNIFIVHGKHIDVGRTMARLYGVEIMSQFFFAHGMC